VPVLVLDPLSDQWATEYVFNDPDHFLQVVRASRCCAVFVDEAAEAVGHWDKHRHWLATRSRHYGHNVHFISQRGMQIAPTVRDQTSALALFRISLEDATTLAKEWARPELVTASQLNQYEFLWITRFGELRKLRLNPPWERVAPASRPSPEPEAHPEAPAS